MEEFQIKTYVAIILDKSFSMNDIKQEAISGYNEQISILKDKTSVENSGEWYVSFVTFNHEVDVMLWNQPVNTLSKLHNENYRPNGMTAMLDAVGYTIDRLMRDTDTYDENNSYLIVIISDGQENGSKTYTWRIVSSKIQELESSDRWTFTYLGANQNIEVVKKKLCLKDGNVALFETTKEGATKAFDTVATSLGGYVDLRMRGLRSVQNFYGTGELSDKEAHT